MKSFNVNEYVETATSKFEDYGSVMKVQAFLKLEYDLSDNQAREVTTAAGLKRSAASSDSLMKCVEIMRTSNLNRKDMIQEIVKECGYTESTANHYISAMPLCKERARQDNE